MAEELIRHTKSLSPLSLKVIDAKIVLDENNIYLSKKDENGREYKTLVEKDPELYLLLTKPTGESFAQTQSIFTYVSSKCNLNCKVCYEGSGNEKEASLEEISSLLEKYRGCKISMMGKEPTCRKDIFELIERAGNRACLVTNGIKLAALEYVKKLKRCGLKQVCFSFNGLNDDIYRKMNGENLLDSKLKALENLELEKIDTELSATVSRGINEDQILSLIEFCLERRSFIFGLKIRTVAPIGKHLNSEQICLSELIGLVADSLLINKTDILREFCFIQAVIENFSWLLPKSFRDKYGYKLCSFIFHIKKESGDKYSSPGSRIDLAKINKSVFKSPYFIYYLIKAYGPLVLVETILYALNLPKYIAQKKMLNITLKCWPSLYTVDLTEMYKCPSLYYKNGEMEKFCLSNIKNSAKEETL